MEIRKKQIDEAIEALGGLEKTKESAEEKKAYYDEKKYMNTFEIVGISLNTASTLLDIPVSLGYIFA